MNNDLVTGNDDPYLRTVRTEVAMELINSVRAAIYARVYQLDEGDEAARLTQKAIALRRLLGSLDCNEQQRVEAVIRHWGPLLKDEQRLWPALQDNRPLLAA
jgi:hypothetical protein